MRIKKIALGTMGRGFFRTTFAVIQTDDNHYFYYALEYSDSWTDTDDYLDNAKSDFLNEFESKDGIFESSLFTEILNDDELYCWNEDWIIDNIEDK